jgi:hypothetical protein
MANKLAEARAQELLALAKGAVVVEEKTAAQPAVADIADAEDAEDDIEMDAVVVGKRKPASRASSRSSRKRVAIAKSADKSEKAEKPKAEKRKAEKPKAERPKAEDKAVAEATLPANVANKTDKADGKLSVTSNVPALIYVDGRSTQMMTPKKFAVPAGKHKITLLEPTSKKAKTQDVEIMAGKTASIDKQF